MLVPGKESPLNIRTVIGPLNVIWRALVVWLPVTPPVTGKQAKSEINPTNTVKHASIDLKDILPTLNRVDSIRVEQECQRNRAV